MQSFRFERIWLLSESERKARRIDLADGANALVGTNHTGKSTVLRSLFSAFGCSTRPLGGEWNVRVATAVQFSAIGKSYTILRHEGGYSLFDENRSVLWATTEAGELRDRFSKLVNFVLPLSARGTLTSRLARPAFFFVPFFIDQDGSWDSSWRTFRGLGEFQDWERPTLDLALGIRSSEYWQTASELTTCRKFQEELEREQRVVDSAKLQLLQKFPKGSWFRDAIAFRQELKALEAQAGHLAVEQDKVRSALIDIASEREALRAQLRLVDGALGAHDEDMRYLDRQPPNQEIICPTCGTPHEHSFYERLGLQAEADELRDLRAGFVRRIDLADREHSQAAERLADVDRQAAEVEALLNQQKGGIKLREIVDRAGRDSALAAFQEQEEHLNIQRGRAAHLEEQLLKKLSALDDPKRSKEIRARFNALYSRFATELQVPPSLLRRRGEVRTRPQQGGSGGPRAVLAYYYAIAHTAAEFSGEVVPPLVIDSPHQKAQDEINRPIVTEFIFRNRVDSQQLIVGVEEALPQTVVLGAHDRKIELRERYGLLVSDEFEEVSQVIRPLMSASVARLSESLEKQQ